MIIVRNTKELEERYNLSEIPDYEQVMVLGGMEGKEKYNYPQYKERITYTGRQIKQIVAQMRGIESFIPESWDEYQRAKYIYRILGNKIAYSYDYKQKSDNPSNLTILLNREGICAGYSLLYKEMMDRQGIQCEYVRGDALNAKEKVTEKHAWNVLLINGQEPVQVDLTWDSERMQNGYDSFRFFGNSDFDLEHKADEDERKFPQYKYLSLEQIESIDTTGAIPHNIKLASINNAIDETYRKYSKIYGKDGAREFIKRGIENYIDHGDLLGFTRTGDGRDGIERNVSQEEMLNQLTRFYVENFAEPRNKMNTLEYGVLQTLSKYDEEQAIFAIERYIKEQDSSAFTNQRDARTFIEQMTPQEIRELVIEKIIDTRVEIIEANLERNNSTTSKNGFSAVEFAQVQLPEERKSNIIKSALSFIKSKIAKKKQSARINTNTRDENVNSIEYEVEK